MTTQPQAARDLSFDQPLIISVPSISRLSSTPHTHLMVKFFNDERDRITINPDATASASRNAVQVHDLKMFRSESYLAHALPLASKINGIMEAGFHEEVVRTCLQNVPDMWLRLWESYMLLRHDNGNSFGHPCTRLSTKTWQDEFFKVLLSRIDNAIADSNVCAGKNPRSERMNCDALQFVVRRDYARKPRSMTLELVFTSYIALKNLYRPTESDAKLFRLAVGFSIQEIDGQTLDVILAARH
jgi:hypothetical protein